MKIFGRTGGYYLFWCSFIYLVIGLTCAVYYKVIQPEIIQIAWIFVLALPLLVPPVAHYFNMEPVMFNLFRKNKMPENVVPFPAPKGTPPMPYVKPPPAPPEKESKTYYTFGLTDNNRLSFQMGYSTLTMNHAGVQNLIDQLEFFKDQLHEED